MSVNELDIVDNSMIEPASNQIASFDDSILQTYKHATTHPTVQKFSSIGIQNSAIQNPIGDISLIQDGIMQNGSAEVSVTPLNTRQIGTTQIGSTKNDISQFRATQIDLTQIDSSKVPLPSLIPIQKLISSNLSHDNTSLLTSIYSTAQSLWQTTTPIDLTFTITNLPTGQLAEGTITSHNTNGTPKTATITIDDDANGVGWFLDSTPQDNSEFTGVDNYLQAAPNNAASGKYDLLTAILHEMGHTLGIINGYSEFDKYVKNGIFTADTLTTKLTSDGSHLDSTLYPYDLMNTSLKPGVRKLPSAMDWAIINAISGTGRLGDWGTGGTVNPAHLTASALIGITNGDFTTATTWNTAGATNIINQPTHGTLTPNPLLAGNFTYTPNPTYVGTDSFTYLGISPDGQISNLATVNITITGVPTTIDSISIPTNIKEGQPIQLSATATTAANNTLTYNWYINNATTPIVGKTINYTFADNGVYPVKSLGFEAQPNLQFATPNFLP